MRSTAHSKHLLIGGIVIWKVGILSAQTANLGATQGPLPEVGFSVLRVFGALVFVLALFLGGVWLFRNWQRFAAQKGKAQKLTILEVKGLGHRHGLYLVGYQQQRLLLASSSAGVTLVSHLPDAELATEQPVLSDPTPFSQTLQKLLVRTVSLVQTVKGENLKGSIR
jgi:flagellar biogenesis protein FliO